MKNIVYVMLLFIAGCSCNKEVIRTESRDSTWVDYHLVNIPIPMTNYNLDLLPMPFIGYQFEGKDGKIAGNIDTVNKKIKIAIKRDSIKIPLPTVNKKNDTFTEKTIEIKPTMIERVGYGAVGFFVGLFLLFFIYIFFTMRKI